MAPSRVALALPLVLAAALRPVLAETPRAPEFVVEPESTGDPAPAIVQVSFSPDGRSLLCCDARGSIVVRDALGGARLRSFAAPCLVFLGAVQTRDGRVLAATWGANRIQVRDQATREDLVNCVQTAWPGAGAISQDGAVFACRDAESIRVFDLAARTELPPIRLKPPGDARRPWSWLSLSRNGELILANGQSAVWLIEKRTGHRTEAGWSGWNQRGTLSPDGSTWLTESGGFVWQHTLNPAGETLPTWGEEDAGATRESGPSGSFPLRNAERMLLLAWSPEGRLAAALHDPRSVVDFLDTWTGRSFGAFACADATALAFSPDGRRIASGHEDGSVRVWRVPDPPALPAAAAVECTDNLWGILACDAPERVREAALGLIARGDEAVDVLRERFAFREKEATVLHLVEQLGDGDPATRAAARKELEWMGVLAEPGLRRALAGEVTEAVRKEAGELLDLAESRQSRSRVTRQRSSGLRILESIGSSGALDVLQRVADESPSPREASDAEAAIDRLRARAAEIR